MAENNISTSFVITGKRPVIVVRQGNRKSQYPAEVSTTKTHADAVRKFVTKVYGKASKAAVLTKIQDGPTGDRYSVSLPEQPSESK